MKYILRVEGDFFQKFKVLEVLRNKYSTKYNELRFANSRELDCKYECPDFPVILQYDIVLIDYDGPMKFFNELESNFPLIDWSCELWDDEGLMYYAENKKGNMKGWKITGPPSDWEQGLQIWDDYLSSPLK